LEVIYQGKRVVWVISVAQPNHIRSEGGLMADNKGSEGGYVHFGSQLFQMGAQVHSFNYILPIVIIQLH